MVKTRYQISSLGQPLTKSVFDLAPSLAELRERTIERGEESEQADSTSERPLTTPSAVCAQSVISALPPKEIQQLIQEVKDLDEDTLKVTFPMIGMVKCYVHRLQAIACSRFSIQMCKQHSQFAHCSPSGGQFDYMISILQ